MSSVTIYIVVEGQTEQTFVRDVLAPWMADKGIYLHSEKTEIEVSQVRRIIEEFKNPEEINDDPVKAPSKRLKELKNGYRKVAMGKTVSEAIGIQAIQKQCPHFNDWLTKLEHLKGSRNQDGKR